MDDQNFAQMTERLKQVNGVITKLDPAIKADAFSLLKGYISGDIVPPQVVGSTTTNGTGEESGPDLSEAEAFFTTHDGGKPADNAYLVAAYLYSQHGASPFSIDDVRAVATQAGLTLPERVDVTLGGGKKAGKQLFKRAGRGRLQPNVHGETYLRNTYNVTKGRKLRTG
jgi:hypothetical protein